MSRIEKTEESFAKTVAVARQSLAGRKRHQIQIADFTPSAVLLLLVNDDGKTNIPFMVRSEDMRDHSGQVSLPGGKADTMDNSLVETALRETQEELGIPPAHVQVIGCLDDVPTPSQYIITPVVAVATTQLDYSPDKREVQQVFEAPLHTFLDPTKRTSLGSREFRGASYELLSYQFGEHQIWGATARIVSQFCQWTIL